MDRETKARTKGVSTCT